MASYAAYDTSYHKRTVAVARENAIENAQTCPECLREVTPDNFDRHNAVYHPDAPVMFVRPGGFDFNALDVETRITVMQQDREFDENMEDAGTKFIRACRNIKRIHEALRYKRPGFREFYESKRGLSKSTAYRMLSIAEKCPETGQISGDKEALYWLAKPATTEEERREALDLAESGEYLSNARVKSIVEKHNVTAPETIARITVGVKRKSEWVNEADASGYIQPGDESEATPITAPIERIDATIAKRQHNHKIIAAQSSDKPYTPPAPVASESESTAPTASPFTASVEWRDGSYHAVIVMSGYKTEYAAMKAIKEVRSMLIKEQTS